MEQKSNSILVFILAWGLSLTGCSLLSTPDANEKDTVTENELVEPFQTMDVLQEDKRIYEYDQLDSVTNLYITVPKQESSYTFFDLDHWYSFNDITSDGTKLDVIIQEGGTNGPEQGDWEYGEQVVNASIELRGASTRAAAQKSYKIKLEDHAGLWHGQTTLNLNKHIYDFLRIRNKLSFDYFKLIPNITSLRTHFVHLHVKDVASGETAFKDYGLFTHVEQPNKRFLSSRGLDTNGQLYKATEFEFYRYPEQLKLSTDESYDESAFESVLEIKGSEDHTKLIQMLEKVNDLSLDINNVVDEYFERENYLTWLGVNILMGNKDTTTQNFYLYSTLNSNKFFFLPWDYDGAWDYGEQKDAGEIYSAQWQKGVSNYWGSVLHQRFLKDPSNLEQLSKKIEELTEIINKEQTKELLATYYPVVSEFIDTEPDLNYLPDLVENYEEDYYDLIHFTERSKQEYYQSLENPMPVYLGEPQLVGGSYLFTWDPSYDLQGDDITYQFQVSDSIDFSTIYIDKNNLTAINEQVPVNELKAGTNYFRVIITDSKGNTQEAFDRIEGEDDHYYNGVREFYVE